MKELRGWEREEKSQRSKGIKPPRLTMSVLMKSRGSFRSKEGTMRPRTN